MPENWWEFPQRIEAAETMEDLAALHDELTQAWNNGEVDHEVVESLTALLWKRDKMLPLYQLRSEAPAGPPVPEGVCPACRQSQWWDKAGHKICAVCHPQPKRFTN